MNFYLLRHGAYDKGKEILNKYGVNQIQEATTYLKKKINNSVIMSSQGPRAKQTAEMIAKEFEVEFCIVDWLDKLVENQNTDVDSVVHNIREINLDNFLLIITNGEFIHQFIEKFLQNKQASNLLKPLIPGEVILCEVSNENIAVEYF